MSSIVIKGNTSGQIELAAPAVAGTNTLTLPASTGTLATTADIPASGKILQVLNSNKTDAYTTTNTAYQIPSGLSVVITPSSTSSKILVMATTQFAIDADTGHGYATLQRDGTAILQGDAAGSRPRVYVAQNNFGNNAPPNYQLVALDSPSTTSAVTYSLGVRSSNGTTLYLNRSVRDADTSGYDGRSASTIIVMEVAG